MNLYINLDGSFQNRYYAVDGVNKDSAKKSGLDIALQLLLFGLKVASAALGGGGGFEFSGTMTI
jgi:predicted ABC-type sugar transport system permease subunit